MEPGLYTLKITRGDPLRRVFRIRSQTHDPVTDQWVPGDYLDLTGWTATATIRDAVTADTVAVTLEAVLGDQAATPGAVTVQATADDTDGLTRTAAAWSLRLTPPAGADQYDGGTYLAGPVHILQVATR